MGRKIKYVSILLMFFAGSAQSQEKLGREVVSHEAVALAEQLCEPCHSRQAGIDGSPILNGQNRYYLEKQLSDFRSGARKDELMQQAMSQVGERQIELLALFYSEAPPWPSPASDAEDGSKTAGNIYRNGNSEREMRACMGCHGVGGGGILQFPKLAGQKPQYLANQLQRFKSGQRTNDKGSMMRGLASKLTAAEISQLSAYLSGLQK